MEEFDKIIDQSFLNVYAVERKRGGEIIIRAKFKIHHLMDPSGLLSPSPFMKIKMKWLDYNNVEISYQSSLANLYFILITFASIAIIPMLVGFGNVIEVLKVITYFILILVLNYGLISFFLLSSAAFSFMNYLKKGREKNGELFY